VIVALSIVIPAYNEADRLPGTLAALERWGRTWGGGQVEVIVVDDGSEDQTASLAKRWASELADGEMRAVVVCAPHRGKASAVARGMARADGAVRMFMDADLAVPLGHVGELLAALNDGVDVAIGSRELAGSSRSREPAYRHVLGRGFNRLVRWIAVAGYADTQCGFKAFTGRAADQIFDRIRLYPVDGQVLAHSRVTAFDVELLAIAEEVGLVVREIPVRWRHVERSKVRPVLDALLMLGDALHVRWNRWRGAYARPRQDTNH
jgi:glycosyltransferase involved in cell wall biosynthesis